MAGLKELTKRLTSVETAGQLAGAMKTVSTAKLSQINSRLAAFTPYASACKELLSGFGDRISSGFAEPEPNAPCAVIAFGSDRSLCGSYNSAFLPFLLDTVKQYSSYEKKPLLFVSGKTAVGFLTERGFEIDSVCELGELPEYDKCVSLYDELYELRKVGKLCCVKVVYMHSVNSLTQSPELLTLFDSHADGEANEPSPTKSKADSQTEPSEEVLLLPDRDTVLASIERKVECSALYHALLESMASLHAATLVAMRSACDNADKLKLELSTELHRKRQSIITASVIETSSELTRDAQNADDQTALSGSSGTNTPNERTVTSK